MDEYIDVKIDVFEHVGQRARLRKSLTVSALVEEILKEFDDIAADSPEKYALYLKGVDHRLNSNHTMTQLDIQPQDEFVFEYVRQNIRRMLEPQNYAFLRDEVNGRTYDIQWQPAVIGRPNNDAEHNIVLAVNLQLHPKGLTVSRRHAEITFSGGHYYLEPLAENNPVAVNGKEIPVNARREIKHGDRVQVGKSDLLMTFLTQTAPSGVQKSGAQPVASQPRPSIPSQPAVAERVSQSTPVQPAFAANDGETHLASEGFQLALLVIEKATATTQIGQRLELLSYPSIVGRDLPLLNTEKDVSRRHAEISYDPATRKFYIKDLRSTNGIYLDGNRIEAERPYEIRPGMRIGLGQYVVLRFET